MHNLHTHAPRLLQRGLAAILLSALLLTGARAAKKTSVPHYANRAPLTEKPFINLNIGEVQPEGWLLEQLNRQRDGLTGHLDEIYPAVMGPRNGWLGGDGDVWERGPYWIDGLLPLAYILKDKKLIDKVQPWIEWTLASQQADGYFGPTEDRDYEPGLQRDNAHDWWPKMVMLKVLHQYYMATGDERVLKLMTAYFRYQLQELPKHPLGHWTFWGQRRGGDNLMMVAWLYNITGESFLLDLGKLIHQQTFDWTDAFLNGNYLTRQLSLHTVNVAQGFKEPAIYYQFDKKDDYLRALKTAVNKMRNGIGLPTGLWGGDEYLRFGDPTTGSELCTAVEMMYSLESILAITADPQWADHLERVAYNALPTQATDDYMARQYYQQTNQIACTRAFRPFYTPHADTDILFGQLNGYPCCTSNMHQGWPKLVEHLWFLTPEGGLAAPIYAPSTVTTTLPDGTGVTVREDTAYPFDETITFTFNFTEKRTKEATFPFTFRIPQWCKEQPVITLNGNQLKPQEDIETGFLTFTRTWKAGDEVRIELPASVSISRWYCGSAVVERGPLVYALKIKEDWKKHDFRPEEVRQYGQWYYTVESQSAWNYALKKIVLQQDKLAELMTVEKKPLTAAYPWNQENNPITIRTKGVRVEGWREYNGSVGPICYIDQSARSAEEGDDIELIPYGCTTLRIAEFPLR